MNRFDIVAQELSNGHIVSFNIIREFEDGNSLAQFTDNQGDSYQLVIYYDRNTNQIYPPRLFERTPIGRQLETLTVPTTLSPDQGLIPNYPVDFEQFTETKLYNVRFRINLSPEETFNQLNNINGLMWISGKTFRDLQALNLAFIQGFFLYSPSHFAPLDPESNIVIEQLNAMNRLDMITTNSQPYEEFPHYLDNTPIRQRPYVEFLYWNTKTTQMAETLLQRKPSVVIYTLEFASGVQTLYGADKPLPIEDDRLPAAQKFINGQWVEDYGTSSPLKVENEHYGHYLGEYGPNFEPLLKRDLTHVRVIDMNFDNTVFDELVRIGKELL